MNIFKNLGRLVTTIFNSFTIYYIISTYTALNLFIVVEMAVFERGSLMTTRHVFLFYVRISFLTNGIVDPDSQHLNKNLKLVTP